jgi:hypothetical protein
VNIEFRPNPNFKDDLSKMLEGKLKAVEQLRCPTHNKQAWTENGKLQACCEDMARRVKEAMEKR